MSTAAQPESDIAGPLSERLAARSAVRSSAVVPGLRVEHCDEIDSTNTELMRRARAGRVDPVLLVARHQTAGRGRLGRQWHSATGLSEPTGRQDDSLTFSLGLPLAPGGAGGWSGLSLAVGVAVAEALDPDRQVPIGLKWPNDLWVDGRKLGGILIETAMPQRNAFDAARYAVIGIGLNIGPPLIQGLREELRDGLRTPPAWLREWAPDATADALLDVLAPPLLAAVRRFESDGFQAFAASFASRDVLRDREVQASDGSCGICKGVGADGALRLETASGVQRIVSAEVSLRPLSRTSAVAPLPEAAR